MHQSILCARRSAIRSLIDRYAHARSGSITIITALCSVIIFAIAGGAVDYARWVHSRQVIQSALDAAVLAGGRQLQINSGDEAKAIATARATYDAMRAKYTVDENITFSVANNGLNFRARGNAYVTTPFMNVVGLPNLPIFEEGNHVRAEAVWSAGSNTDTSIEMSLMLDTTGSMGGQKIKDLRSAATEMVDIVVWEDQSRATSRIALAPFSSSVNVDGYINSVIDPAIIAADDHAIKAKCVVERSGTAEFTDAAPGPGAWLTSYNVATGSGTSNCPEDVQIVPLSSDKAVLKAAIADLKAQGSTAGALGSAWAWYLLSPDWSNIWPATAAPATYAKTSELNASGTPKLQKIAVLMTDGTYNTWQASQHSDRSTQATTISNKAVQLCQGMKTKNIIVYTVGFQLDNDLAKDTLKACATSLAHFYDAKDGEALRLAFRDIAIKSTPLRLSQ